MLVALVSYVLCAPAPTGQPLERRLHPVSVEASSFLWNDWNKFQENYHPNYAADDDPKTAWTEGVKGNGEGEWLRVPLTRLEGTTHVRLRLRNGYHKSKGLYAANARPRAVTVELQPSGVTQAVELKDVMEWQEVVVEQPAGPLEAVKLSIRTVYPGRKYEDTCLSDVEVFATSSTPDNPAFEKSRLERLLGWKKERVEAAATFKKERKGSMPVASSYTSEDIGSWVRDTSCDYLDALCHLRESLRRLPEKSPLVTEAAEALEANLAGLAPVHPVPTDTRRLPPVDGVEPLTFDLDLYGFYDEALLLPSRLGFLHADGVGAFDVKDTATFSDAARGNAKACRARGKTATLGWARFTAGEPRRLRVLALAICGMAEARDGYLEAGQPALLVYDDQGRLGLFVTAFQASLLTWSDEARPVLRAAVTANVVGSRVTRHEHRVMVAGR